MSESAANPDVPAEVDVVVVGGGPAGENIADRVSAAGLSCIVVESELFGGECSYWACMPSKALLRPVEVRNAARRLPGVPVGELDATAVLKRRDAFTNHHDDAGQVEWIEMVGARAVRGTARLDGERRVFVTRPDGEHAVTARHAVVLAVGTDAAMPPVPGLREAQPWTSREATSAEAVPGRLVILGGGVVACELAQAYKGLGAREVTIVELAPRLLGRLEPFAGELVAEAFEDDGIGVRVDAQVEWVERESEGGPVALHLTGGERIEADELLVATGRTPRTRGLGLDSVGLTGDRLNRGYVPTDDTLTVEGVDGGWLYAVGDVNGRSLLTHMGKYQARICADVIVARARGEELGGDRRELHDLADDLGAPAVVFTDPQVAAVGRTEAEARESGLDVRVVEYDVGSVAGASLLADGYRGRAKLVVDESRRVVVGATFVGHEVAELLHSATIAVVGQVPLDLLWHAVPSYPTVSEVWLRLLEEYGL